jgi:ankyrin repeat protein
MRKAAENGHIHVVQYLWKLELLTDEDIRADNNYALRMACSNGHVDVVMFLLDLKILIGNDFYDRNEHYRSCKDNYHLLKSGRYPHL